MNFLFLISGWFVSYLNLQSCRIKLDYLFHIKLLPKIISFLCIANLSYIWSIHTANSSFSNHLFQNNQSFFTFIQSKTKGYIYITSTILNFRKMCIIFLCWLMKRGYETHPQLFFFPEINQKIFRLCCSSKLQCHTKNLYSEIYFQSEPMWNDLYEKLNKKKGQ